jgi:capsular exopolysaccharide synthesis family protein
MTALRAISPAAPIRASTEPVTGAALLETFGLMDVLAILRRRLLTFLGVGAVAGLLVLLPFLLGPRLYTAVSTLALDLDQSSLLGRHQSSPAPPADDSALVDSEAGIVGSRAVMERVIALEKLDTRPEFNKALEKYGPLGLVFGAPELPATETEMAITQSRVLEEVGKRLKVKRFGRTRLVEVEFKSRDAALAARVANAFASEYIRDSLDSRRNQAAGASDFLRGRLGMLRDDVTSAEGNAERFRTREGLMSADGVTLIERQIVELQTQLITLRSDLDEKNARADEARRSLAATRTSAALPEVLMSNTIGDLRRQEAEIVRQLADLRQNFGPKWPELRRKEQELNDLRAQIDAEADRIASTLDRDAAIARQRVSAMAITIANLQSRLGNVNVAQVQLRDIERNADASRALYEEALAKLKEEDIRGAFMAPNARVVSEAATPRRPSEPRRILGLIFATIAGLVAGLAAVIGIELFDRTFWTPRAFESQMGLRHLALIPAAPALKVDSAAANDPEPIATTSDQTNGFGKRLNGPPTDAKAERARLNYSIDHPYSNFTEAVRALRANVLLSSAPAPKVVMFTSALPGEGKTFTTLNYARISAMTGARTLAIDCDLRRRGLTRALGLRPTIGLVEVLDRSANLDAAILRDSATNLDILPLANTKLVREDILEGRALRDLLHKVSERYDAVIVDSAPVLLVAGTRLLAEWVNAVVLVVQWRKTNKGVAAAAIEALDGAPLIGAVLSQVDISRPRLFEDGDMGAYLGAHAEYYRK